MKSSIDLTQFRTGSVHFVGCAGVGTYPLAQILKENGFSVSGSDLLPVEQAAFPVFTGHDEKNLPSPERSLLLIHSSAAAPDNPEILAARQRENALVIRRGSALAALTSLYKRVVSVSGSHGKTSVSGMLAYLFSAVGQPGFLVGGYLTGWGKKNGSAGQGNDLFFTEVDESDGTHVEISSWLGIVTNVEDDHAWSVGGTEQLYRNFQTYAMKARRLIYVGSPLTDRLFAAHPSARRIDTADLDDWLKDFDPATLKMWGTYQKINAVTVLAAAEEIGLDRKTAAEILSRFPGVERRMSVRVKDQLIEDYAHHPTELRASLSAFREVYPGRRLVAVFQPHRYARLERYFDEFAEVLRMADQVFITPVFAAWTASGKYDSATLAEAVGEKASAVSGSWKEIADQILSRHQAGDLIAVIGAGDLKDVIPYLAQALTASAEPV